MSLMLALLLLAPPQDPTLTDMPESWINGKKSGWDGDYPPGWDKKTDEEKKKFLERWNNAKFRYIKAMSGVKGTPTGPVAGILIWFKSVNAGLAIEQGEILALFGHTHKLKQPDYEIMFKGASSVHGTEVPHPDAVAITKEAIVAGLRGTALEQKVRAEIQKKHKQLADEKARREKEKEKQKEKEKEGGDKDKKE